MKLVSMKLDPEDQKEEVGISPPDLPQYPYGLCLRLDDDELDKLGLENLPAVGSEVNIVAVAKVTSASISATESNGEDQRCELQITDLSIEPVGNKKSTEEMLYGTP